MRSYFELKSLDKKFIQLSGFSPILHNRLVMYLSLHRCNCQLYASLVLRPIYRFQWELEANLHNVPTIYRKLGNANIARKYIDTDLLNISHFCKIFYLTPYYYYRHIGDCNNRPAKKYSCRKTPHCSTSATAAISIKNKLFFGPVPVHVSIWNMSHLHMRPVF